MRVANRCDDGTFVLFDAMRWLAAMLVVLEHARHVLLLDYAGGETSLLVKGFYFVSRFGHEAVLVFFVLSGFWITSVVDRRFGRPDFWREYLIARGCRLLVVLVPALLLGGALDSLGLHALHGALYEGRLRAEAFPQSIAPLLRPEVFLGNLLFLQGIVVPALGTNGPLWSLANEFWYYLWFPALYALVRHGRWSWALPTLAIGLVAPLVLELFPVWLFGSGLYYAHKAASGRLRLNRRGASLALVGALAAFIGALAASRFQALDLLLGDWLVGFSFAVVLWCLLQRRPPVPLPVRPLAHLGATASFSLYAIHYPLLAMLATLLNGDVRLGPTLPAMALVLAVTAVLACCGVVFARLTEAHTATLRRWIRQTAGLTDQRMPRLAGASSPMRDPGGG